MQKIKSKDIESMLCMCKYMEAVTADRQFGYTDLCKYQLGLKVGIFSKYIMHKY
jgi:hypothetical protein